MKPSDTKPNKLDVWGDSLLNKLRSRTRKKRKRDASKKRRAIFDRLLKREIDEG